jgi:hypothetical protein
MSPTNWYLVPRDHAPFDRASNRNQFAVGVGRVDVEWTDTRYERVGVGRRIWGWCTRVGESVSSVNRTLFSILVLRPLSRLRPTSPSVRTWIHTPTPMPSLYGFKPHLDPSKGAARRGVASRSQTTESAAPAASVCSMACFMASHACLALPLPLPLLSRVALLPNPTPIAHTGTVSTFDSLSPHLIGGLLELFIEAGE